MKVEEIRRKLFGENELEDIKQQYETLDNNSFIDDLIDILSKRVIIKDVEKSSDRFYLCVDSEYKMHLRDYRSGKTETITATKPMKIAIQFEDEYIELEIQTTYHSSYSNDKIKYNLDVFREWVEKKSKRTHKIVGFGVAEFWQTLANAEWYTAKGETKTAVDIVKTIYSYHSEWFNRKMWDFLQNL